MDIKKLGYFSLAWISLLLAIVGIVLPLLPTTPFLLVSAYGFSKSSERFHQWLLNHKVFGAMILDWNRHGVISLKSKVIATVSMIAMLSLSLTFVAPAPLILILILVMILLVLIFIWSRPSTPKKS